MRHILEGREGGRKREKTKITIFNQVILPTKFQFSFYYP